MTDLISLQDGLLIYINSLWNIILWTIIMFKKRPECNYRVSCKSGVKLWDVILGIKIKKTFLETRVQKCYFFYLSDVTINRMDFFDDTFYTLFYSALKYIIIGPLNRLHFETEKLKKYSLCQLISIQILQNLVSKSQ